MPGRVAIVIVNWNNRPDTLECLASIQQDRYPDRRVILVDNGSTDGTADAVRAAYPDVAVLETGANLGFSGGNNVGIRAALVEGADYLFLLNNDTVLEPETLSALVTGIEANPRFGLVTPVIYYYDAPDTPWFAGSILELESGIAVHDNARTPALDEAPYVIPWASGCAMLVRAEVMRRLGGFDDRYFLIWEDVDLCLRARAAGYEIGIAPGARLYHRVSRSFKKQSHLERYYHVRNNLLLVLRLDARSYRRAALRIVGRDLRESLGAIRRRRTLSGSDLGATVRAILHHVMRRYGALR